MESDLALALAVVRVIRGWTQEELADASGVRASSISDYERGRKTPEMRTLQRLLAAMELPLAAVDEAQRCVSRIRGLKAAFDGEAGDLEGNAASRGASELGSGATRLEIDDVAEDSARLVARLVRFFFLQVGRPGAGEPGLCGTSLYATLAERSLAVTAPRSDAQEIGELDGHENRP
jgi:transcriptional regulator with XRE-family HTH domain